MKANAGDRIVIVSSTLDHHTRDGRIVEVRGADGEPPYLVEWADNGHQGLIFPGPDAHVQHLGSDGSPVPTPREPVVRKRNWEVRIDLSEVEGRTTAHATLVGDRVTLQADGGARLNPADADVPIIGDELAAARALRRLADALLGEAAADLSAADGTTAVLQSR